MDRNRKRKHIFHAVVELVLIIAIILTTRYFLAQKTEEDRLAQDAYFTEYHLSCIELNDLMEGFYVDTEPKLNVSWLWQMEDLDQSKWPDYSDFIIKSTDTTDKMVVVLNSDLFDQKSEYDQTGIERAQELGFTTDNRLTTEWVMSHPKEAVYILNGMYDNGEMYKNHKSDVESWYQKIVNGNDTQN